MNTKTMKNEITKTPELKTQLALTIKGEIISSNLPTYAAEIKAFIAALPSKLETDEDFEGAKNNVKSLKLVEDAVKAAREDALKQAKGIYTTLEELGGISDTARDTRLMLNKLVTSEEARKRTEAVEDALDDLASQHPTHRARIEAAMKGKQLKGAIEAARKEGAEIKSEIMENEKTIEEFAEKHGEALIYGYRELVHLKKSALDAELDARLARQIAAEEKAKLELKLEEARKADAKARAEEAENKPAPAFAGHPSIMPAPPKIDTIPVGRPAVGGSMAEEAAEFRQFVERSIAAPLREHRLALHFPSNREAAEVFSKAMGAAWSQFLVDTNQI